MMAAMEAEGRCPEPAAAVECGISNCSWRVKYFWQLKHSQQMKALRADLIRANKKLRDAREDNGKLRERINELEGGCA